MLSARAGLSRIAPVLYIETVGKTEWRATVEREFLYLPIKIGMSATSKQGCSIVGPRRRVNGQTSAGEVPISHDKIAAALKAV